MKEKRNIMLTQDTYIEGYSRQRINDGFIYFNT